MKKRVHIQKPTARAGTLIVASVVLYFFANQTQVGYIYVMAAAMMGVVLCAWWLNQRALLGVLASRSLTLKSLLGVQKADFQMSAAMDSAPIADQSFHEGDEVTVTLALSATRIHAAQLAVTERCPLAAPDSPHREQALYVPTLPHKQSVSFSYDVTIDRRGVHTFASLPIVSRTPFGVFARRGTIDAPASLLVYPEVHSLRRLALLDRQLAPQMPRAVAGFGYEVIGARPYRSGDSPRHVHWRSTARTGQLISKEFADEAQPGLTLVLDVFAYPYAQTKSKHTPFEMAIKIAASIGDYARKRGYPLYLMVDDSTLPAPGGAVEWTMLLEYLAKVQPQGTRPLSQVISPRSTQTYVAVVLPYPDTNVVSALSALRAGGTQVLAVVIDPETFPTSSPRALQKERGVESQALVGALQAASIDTRMIAHNDDWTLLLGDFSTSLNPTPNRQHPIASTHP
ncbi:MAG: DUF58 domain-containing protein [Chloroflexota bacterium]|nr:DUF58 domain-containing protein [Chloroflexota bacterium]